MADHVAEVRRVAVFHGAGTVLPLACDEVAGLFGHARPRGWRGRSGRRDPVYQLLRHRHAPGLDAGAVFGAAGAGQARTLLFGDALGEAVHRWAEGVPGERAGVHRDEELPGAGRAALGAGERAGIE